MIKQVDPVTVAKSWMPKKDKLKVNVFILKYYENTLKELIKVN